MTEVKYVFFILILVVLQACASSKGNSDLSIEKKSENQADSLSVGTSQSAEEAGIRVKNTATTKSIVTPKKKKK